MTASLLRGVPRGAKATWVNVASFAMAVSVVLGLTVQLVAGPVVPPPLGGCVHAAARQHQQDYRDKTPGPLRTHQTPSRDWVKSGTPHAPAQSTVNNLQLPEGMVANDTKVRDGSQSRSAKKSLPLSSVTMKAGKSSTSMRQMASMPSSGYSRTSTRLMEFWARIAAGPPIDPR